MFRNVRSHLGVLAIALGLVFAVSTGAQASECKGLSKSQCSSDDNCSHVRGYVRKDGAKVASHCRAKPGKGAATSAKSKAKSATKRATDKKAAAEKKSDSAKAKSSSQAKASKTTAKKTSQSTAKKATSSAKKTTKSTKKETVKKGATASKTLSKKSTTR